MILGGVDVPDRILEAHEQQSLVFFVGAGLSVAPPSGLPNFAQLAKQIADLARAAEQPTSRRWKSRLDAYLGHLAHQGVAVHDLTRDAVTPKDSRPNALHLNLARIASRTKLRIVTTNYDLHFEAACAELGVETRTFSAPALPLGDDFEGIVHLHGSADGPSRRLVVTDRDFGMAYLRDAWAARFLERMFREYTVVFVGYSHEDVVMKYLGLALGPRSERFAFAPPASDPGWDRLDITPVPYSRVRRHRQLNVCFDAWAKLATMGLLDHQQRIRSLVSRPTKLTPDERAYLLDSMQRPDRAKFFYEEATDPAWLDWAEDEHLLDVLFTRGAPAQPLLAMVADWFVRYTLKEPTSARTWELVTASGGRLSISLWNAVALEIFRLGQNRPEHIRRWIHLLIEEEQDGCVRDYLNYILHSSVWPEDRGEILELLRHLTAPAFSVRGPHTLISSSYQITARGDEYYLTEAISRLNGPALDGAAFELLRIAEESLTRHLRLHYALNATTFDPFAFGRSAIQEDPQDEHRDSIDALIDLAREALTRLAERGSEADDLIWRWLGSDNQLLRRIAIHGLANHGTFSPDEKLNALADRGLLGDRHFQQEIYQLIAGCGDRISAAALERAVHALVDLDDGTTAGSYRIFCMLDWLHTHIPQSDLLDAVLDRLSTAHPDFRPPEHPGFTYWWEVGSVETSPPTSAADLHARIRSDASAAIAYLAEFKNTESFWGRQPGWSDAVSLMAATVRENPADGLLVWDLAAAEAGLRETIISAWATVTDGDLLSKIVARLLNVELTELVGPVGQLLAAIPDGNDSLWDHIPGIGELLDRFWDACEGAASDLTGGGWFARAINHPAGHLMEFWYKRFRRAWAASDDSWRQLRQEDAEFLQRAIEDSSERGRIALALTAGRAHWIHIIDPEWFKAILLPLTDWNDPDSALVFWHGFLYNGRLSADSLRAGLLDGLLKTGSHFEVFDRDQQWRWARLLATAALEVGLSGQLDWLQRLTASVPITGSSQTTV
jgi:hypothetical protein